MEETGKDQTTTGSASSSESASHRHPVRGNTLLTTVVCAWDASWMRAVDPAVSGLRAEHTSLMSLGDDACRFRVVRTSDPLAPYTDELHQRFSGEQATG